jgi:hypothetical protein
LLAAEHHDVGQTAMRFFTMAWWRETQSDEAANPSDAYDRHLQSLRPFPDAVAAIDRMPSLHDARLKHLEEARESVVMTIDRLGETGSWVATELRYGGVERLVVSADPDGELPGPSGFGDLGYDEFDAAAPGLYEHRLLFSSGLELCIQFRSLTIDGEAVQHRVAADRAAPGR